MFDFVVLLCSDVESSGTRGLRMATGMADDLPGGARARGGVVQDHVAPGREGQGKDMFCYVMLCYVHLLQAQRQERLAQGAKPVPRGSVARSRFPWRKQAEEEIL